MTTYFAKYLPVDGEIRQGDVFLSPDHSPVVTKEMSPEEYIRAKCQKAELFICSNNFRKDSVVRTLKRPDIDYVVTEIFDMETVFIHSDLDITTSFAHPLTIFRPVGKVSSEATWVKDGDKFTAKQLFANGVGLNWNDSDRNLYFKVLGSCGHYH